MSNNAYWLGGLLALLLVIGLWLRQREGRIKLPPSVPITESIAHRVLDLSPLEVELGEVTFVQFSSTFCQPCRATRLLIEDVAKHFEHTADQEILHAWGHLELLIGRPSTKECLEKAIEGETYEYTTMYPDFQTIAKAEGQTLVANEMNEQT